MSRFQLQTTALAKAGHVEVHAWRRLHLYDDVAHIAVHPPPYERRATQDCDDLDDCMHAQHVVTARYRMWMHAGL